MYELSGKLKWIGETQTFASGFIKREFVVTTAHDKYPQDIKFEIVKDKCPLLDPLELNQDARVPKANATVRERPPTKVLKFSKEKGLLRPFPFDG